MGLSRGEIFLGRAVQDLTFPGEAGAVLNLGGFALILYVDMDWLMVIGIEEKTYPEDKKDCWHIFKIYAKV